MDKALAKTVIDEIAANTPTPGLRALHAKGTLCTATFTPTAEAARLSHADHFTGPTLRAHVRFSNGSGVIGADYAPREGRGMAVKRRGRIGLVEDVKQAVHGERAVGYRFAGAATRAQTLPLRRSPQT